MRRPLPTIKSTSAVFAFIITCMVSVAATQSAHLLHTGARYAREPMVRCIAGEIKPRAVEAQSMAIPLKLPLPRVQQQGELNLPAPPPGSNFEPVTPINPGRLFKILGDSPRARRLYSGFRYGFRIPHKPSPWSHPVRNHTSVHQNPQFMDQYIDKELKAGRIVGPFTSLPPHCIISPLGLVPKQEAGAFRVIHDLLFPKGRGVNDLIPNHLTSVNYEDFEYVVGLVHKAGEGALLAKVDIQNAFRIMPIHPHDIHLFGFF